MTRRRTVSLTFTLVGVITALGIGQRVLAAKVRVQTVQAPRFEVDPMWPKPLPNHWILGSTIGVGVDARDHVFIIHRGDSTLNQRTEVGADAKPPLGECCRSAPPILEFDPEGNLVKAMGRSGRGLHVAELEPRHHDRRQGQRLDRRERQRRFAHPQVHARRQVPGAVRHAGPGA